VKCLKIGQYLTKLRRTKQNAGFLATLYTVYVPRKMCYLILAQCWRKSIKNCKS